MASNEPENDVHLKAEFNPETYHPTIRPVFPFQDNSMGRLIADLEARIIRFRSASMMASDPVEVTRLRAKADTLNYVRAEIILALEEMDPNAE
jgi:hypothetical protein